MTDAVWKAVVWGQFGAAIDMLENAIIACPDDLWGDRSQHPEFWYTAFHALFYLDCYLADSEESFRPPPPFTRDELDERGIFPDRVYTKDELLAYLEHGRATCRSRIAALTEAESSKRCGFPWLDITVAELHLYNMRHVQHHAAQLNMMLSQKGHAAPRWVRTAKGPIGTT